MANYVIKEMPTGMGNGKKGRLFPKMQVYTEFDYDKVVELIHTNSPAFSQATVRGVLDTLAVVMKSYLPMGHTMKIDNLGVFSLSLEFADNEVDSDNQQAPQKPASKKKYHHVRVKGVNFKVDKKMHNRQPHLSLSVLPRRASATCPYPYRQTRLHHPSGIRQPQQPPL